MRTLIAPNQGISPLQVLLNLAHCLFGHGRVRLAAYQVREAKSLSVNAVGRHAEHVLTTRFSSDQSECFNIELSEAFSKFHHYFSSRAKRQQSAGLQPDWLFCVTGGRDPVIYGDGQAMELFRDGGEPPALKADHERVDRSQCKPFCLRNGLRSVACRSFKRESIDKANSRWFGAAAHRLQNIGAIFSLQEAYVITHCDR